MRAAMKRWVSGAIMRSSSATRNHAGRSFQSGRSTRAEMQAGEMGRWTAESSACSSGRARCANAAANAASGR